MTEPARSHPPPDTPPSPIGVFDSGVGGLGVLAEIRRTMPDADLLYVADHAAAPYGERSLDEVRRRSDRVADWLAAEGCRVITVACNTASAAALHHLRRTHPGIAFVGMEPAVKPAASLTASGRVGVVATAATFQGELFASVVGRFASGVEVVTAACPTWVELVERGTVEGAEAEAAVRDCLAPMLAQGVDVVVLACTHYPALRSALSRVLGPDTRIIDPAPAVAAQTGRLAAAAGVAEGRRSTRFVTTGDPSALARAMARGRFGGEPAVLPLP